MTVLLALTIGIVAGLRTLTAPAAIAWAARLGRLNLAPSVLAFAGYASTAWILTILAIGELVIDLLPSTPSRTEPAPFAGRIIMGAVCGGAIGIPSGLLVVCTIAGVAGAAIGTLGGRAARGWLATTFGSDPPAALLEDSVAIGAAFAIFIALP